MSLILPGSAAFQYVQDNLDGVSPGTTIGTAFTCGASSADGTAVEVMQLDRDCHYLVLGFTANAVSTADNSALLSILGDASGGTSYADMGLNYLPGWPGVTHSGASSGGYFWYHLPVYIKSGTALAIVGRRNAAATLAYRCVMHAYCAPKRPEMWWCGKGIEALGAVPSTSKGVFVTPGASGAWGSYTTLGTSTRRYGAIQIGINGSDATTNSAQYIFQLGAGSARLPGSGTAYAAMTTTELNVRMAGWQPELVDVPSGTVVQGRVMCNSAGPEDQQMIAVGVF